MKHILSAIAAIALTTLFATNVTADPTLIVDEERRGSWTFTMTGFVIVDDPAGCDALPWNFSWVGMPDDPNSGIEYRYGWDIVDMNDDDLFETGWGDVTSAPARTFFFGTHVFTVQARDDAGVVTSANVRMNIIISSPLPSLTITEATRGAWPFVGTTGPDVALTEMLTMPAIPWAFSWDGFSCVVKAANNGAMTDDLEYRYGFDITDPADDSQWTAWGVATSAPPQTFFNGRHNFMVEARDIDGNLTRGVVTMEVMPTVPTQDATWGHIKSKYVE